MAADGLPRTWSPDPGVPFTLGAQIEARSTSEELRDRVFLEQGDRSWTWGRYRQECVRIAHLVLSRSRRTGGDPARVAMLLENHLEVLSLLGGCAYAGATLFALNTSLGGDALARVLRQSGAGLLVVGERFLDRVGDVLHSVGDLGSEDVLVVPDGTDPSRHAGRSGRPFEVVLAGEIAGPGEALEPPPVTVAPDANLMVVYTSGTTGVPRGVRNDNAKLCLVGMAFTGRLGLTPDDCGYACLPLFHSNALFLGFMPALWAGGRLLVRERFSASAFLSDVLDHGVTFWDYIGEPLHYVLGAVERSCGGDEDRIRSEVTANPGNRLRHALGNGATPRDIDRFERWFGAEVLEMYGSTEGGIGTMRSPGDPPGSVGEAADPAVRILDADGHECPPGTVDSTGRLRDPANAIGEICRVADDTSVFQGYHDDPEADRQRYHDGVYHSGDLGHVVVVDGRRYLYLDGRAEDWIRKDGENFSAVGVAGAVAEHPDVEVALAYGVPAPVADDLVMVALQLRKGEAFDPDGFAAFCSQAAEDHRMEPKWVPDVVRIVAGIERTPTGKAIVRHLRRERFHPAHVADPLFVRQRGGTYERLDAVAFERLRAAYDAAGRGRLLDR